MEKPVQIFAIYMTIKLVHDYSNTNPVNVT